MEIKAVRVVVAAGLGLMLLCFVLFCLTDVMGFAYAAFVIGVVTVIFDSLFYRCPYCKKSLGGSYGEFCPHCGRKLD